MLSTMTTKASPTTDLEAIQALILWARKERIVVHEVTVGTVKLVLGADLSLATSVTPPREDAAKHGAYERYGGELLAEVARGEEAYEDDDDVAEA